MSEKEELIERILELELNMFLNVPSRYPVSCQQDPDGFRLHRGAQFSVWSKDTLQSYHDDLIEATEQGHNLMSLKYARMENIIPPLSSNPLIDEIADMLLDAQKGMLSQYPRFLGTCRPLEDDSSESTSFKTYQRGELETYSDRTLELLHRDIKQIPEGGENWSVQTYAHLVRKLGYKSLDEVEERLRKKAQHLGGP